MVVQEEDGGTGKAAQEAACRNQSFSITGMRCIFPHVVDLEGEELFYVCLSSAFSSFSLLCGHPCSIWQDKLSAKLRLVRDRLVMRAVILALHNDALLWRERERENRWVTI